MFRKLLLLLGLSALGVYVWLAFVGVEPLDRRPGTLLSGTVTPLPDDWSFLADETEVHLETRPWFGIPFSVTTVIVNDDGMLYVPSLYDGPMAFPGTKFWNRVIQRNPAVRLRASGKLYELDAMPVLDEAQFEQGFRALGRKFPFWQKKVEADDSPRAFALIRLQPRSS